MTAEAEVTRLEQDLLDDRTRSGRRKIPALTGVRGYAACWVVLFHAWYAATLAQPSLPPREAVPLVGRGYLGVDLFFVLSGYVLMLTYGRSLERPNLAATRAFAIGRAFRILPLHWLMLLLIAAAIPLMGRDWITVHLTGPAIFLKHVVLVQGWGMDADTWNSPAWSLSAEFLAYLLFPLLVPVVARMGRATALATIVGGTAALQLASLKDGGTGINHAHVFGLLRCLVEFPMGMAACRLRALGLPRARREADGLLLGGFVLFVLGLLAPRWEGLEALAFTAIVLASGAGSAWAERLLGNRVAHYLGEISFSIYLVNLLTLNIAWKAVAVTDRGSVPLTLTALGAACLLVIPLAHASWRWVEVPGQAWGRRLQRRRP